MPFSSHRHKGISSIDIWHYTKPIILTNSSQYEENNVHRPVYVWHAWCMIILEWYKHRSLCIFTFPLSTSDVVSHFTQCWHFLTLPAGEAIYIFSRPLGIVFSQHTLAVSCNIMLTCVILIYYLFDFKHHFDVQFHFSFSFDEIQLSKNSEYDDSSYMRHNIWKLLLYYFNNLGTLKLITFLFI